MQKTFSSCALDKRFDEKEWMDEVVKHTEIDAHFIYPKGEDIFDLSEKILWHMDEPYQSQSIFLSYHVFEAAKNKEQKAKCLYMIAKCERNEYYNKKYSAIANVWEIPEEEVNFIAFDGFVKLKTNYSDTKYYQDVIGECGYFRTYVNQ